MSMEVNPVNTNELGFQLGLGWVGVFNTLIGGVTKLCPVGNTDNMKGYSVKKMGDDAEAVRLSPVLNVKRNCSSFFSKGYSVLASTFQFNFHLVHFTAQHCQWKSVFISLICPQFTEVVNQYK